MNGCVVWLTGLPRSGKSTLATAVRDELRRRAITCAILDGDAVRDALVPRSGYDPDARDGFYATLGNLAALLAAQGVIVLVPATANRRAYRDACRQKVARFIEVHIAASLDECRQRDPHGLYASAPSQLPGIGAPYEPPLAPEVIAMSGHDTVARDAIVAAIIHTP